MRLGAYPCSLVKGTRVRDIYGVQNIEERHRHRYEFNNKFKPLFEKHGMQLSGECKDRNLIEIVEITEHPWFIGVQFHPEFNSKPLDPHPLFKSFVAAALKSSKKQNNSKQKTATKKTKSSRRKSTARSGAAQWRS